MLEILEQVGKASSLPPICIEVFYGLASFFFIFICDSIAVFALPFHLLFRACSLIFSVAFRSIYYIYQYNTYTRSSVAVVSAVIPRTIDAIFATAAFTSEVNSRLYKCSEHSVRGLGFSAIWRHSKPRE